MPEPDASLEQRLSDLERQLRALTIILGSLALEVDEGQLAPDGLREQTRETRAALLDRLAARCQRS
ncbi:MAG TPA: hypothetical protein VM204_09155 [Gaiellaceae bacterium]|nr:hypothetical protein [Gaiellaceae bacterium]